MNTDKILELTFYTLPALITAGVAYVFLKKFIQNDDSRRRFLLMRENQKQALPLRLQAYERMALFLERISLSKLILRVAPIGNDVKDYQNLLIHHIEQELEHNLTQQIYITDECWNTILKAKSSVIQIIREVAHDSTVQTVQQFREQVLSVQLENESPTNLALQYLKAEVQTFF